MRITFTQMAQLDAEHNEALGFSWEDITTDVDAWLATYNGGWTNKDRLYCKASEPDTASEIGFDIEDYYEDAWHKWLDVVNN